MKRVSPSPAALLALAAAVLTGCAVGPDYQPPAAVADSLPARYANDGPSAAADAAPPAGAWWTAFHDPALDQLVDAALAGSPDLAAAEARVQAARAELAAVSGARQPQLEASARAGHDQFSRNSENFANIPFAHPATGFDDYRAGFDASWELDLAGREQRAVEAQAADTAGAGAQRDAAALRLAAETARAVLDWRGWQRRLDNAGALVADRRELLRLTRLQRQAGLVSDIELVQAETALRNDQATLPPLHAAAQSDVAALLVLTGLSWQDITARLATPAPLAQVPEDVATGAPSELLRRRPDVRGAERALAAASARIGVAEAQRWPRFTLVGNAGWDSIHAGTLTRQASQFWSIGPQLSLPLFSGGRLEAEVDASRAQRDAAEAQYRQAVLAALSDVEVALVRCREDRVRRLQLDATADSLARQLALVRQRVDHGDVAETEWLALHLQADALEDQRLALAQGTASDVVALYKALGGDADGPTAGSAGKHASRP